MPTVATYPYEAAFDDLTRCIRKHRDDCIPDEIARKLLSYDNPDHSHLVGVTDKAKSVYLYHCSNQYNVASPLRSDGLSDVGPKLADFRYGSNLDSWLEIIGDYLVWKHPRYRD